MTKFKLIPLLVIAVLYGCAQSNYPATPPTTVGGEQVALSRLPAATLSSNVDGEFDPGNYHKIADLLARLEEVKAANSETLAKVIAELDGWLFSEADEIEARALVSGALVKLRAVIATDVQDSLRTAQKAPDPTQRTAAIRKAEAIIGLFPTPRDAPTQAELDRLVASIKSTVTLLQDSKRLRYNQWALTRIQESLQQFHKAKKISGLKDISSKIFLDDKGKQALIKICQDSLGPINPSYLEPAVLDLYHYSLGLTRASLKENEDLMLNLAQGLTAPTLVRKSPAEF